ncbi:hypothetical protein BKA81DRAFT_370558 [Phyllosticta paracitricarpa]
MRRASAATEARQRPEDREGLEAGGRRPRLSLHQLQGFPRRPDALAAAQRQQRHWSARQAVQGLRAPS